MGAAGFKAYAAFPVTARLFMGIVCAAGAGNMYGTFFARKVRAKPGIGRLLRSFCAPQDGYIR